MKVTIDIGRNDPCFCGSGRKFKQCCLSGTRGSRDATQLAPEHVLSATCGGCGSTERLFPYLRSPLLMSSSYMSYVVSIDLFEKVTGIAPAWREACPRCNSVAIYQRKTMEPVFRCSHCKHTFDHPSSTIASPDKEHRQEYRRFCRAHTGVLDRIVYAMCREQLTERFQEKRKVMLCEQCCYYRVREMVPCKECSRYYHHATLPMCLNCASGSDIYGSAIDLLRRKQ